MSNYKCLSIPAGGKRSFRHPTCPRWFLVRVLWLLRMWAVALKFILMHLMLYVAGSRNHCLQLKFQQLQNGNFDGMHIRSPLFGLTSNKFVYDVISTLIIFISLVCSLVTYCRAVHSLSWNLLNMKHVHFKSEWLFEIIFAWDFKNSLNWPYCRFAYHQIWWTWHLSVTFICAQQMHCSWCVICQ